MTRGKDVATIGSRIEMFVDNWLIEERQGTELRVTPPVKREVVMKFDQPWEGNTVCYFTVIQDEGKIRLYYRGNARADDHDDRQVTCYAESEDGVQFAKPALGVYEYEGSGKNNIIWRGLESHNFAPMKDVSPAAAKESLFKAVGGVAPRGTPWTKGMLNALHSQDGIHWSKMEEHPVITDQPFDSHNIILWDPNIEAYRCYARYWTEQKVRAVHSSVSPDFRTWQPFELNTYDADVPIEHFYTNASVVCPGAEHMYLSFPKRFVESRKKVAEHPVSGLSDTVFMSSRDGLHWDRTFPEGWLRPGHDRKNWTERSSMIAHGIVQLETEPELFSLYVTEHYRWDDVQLRRVTVRKHGFGSLHGGYRGGEATTRPLVFSGNRLLLNYATSAAGSIQVELTDESGRPLEGYAAADMETLYGDELEGVVRWRNGEDVSALAGKPVRIRFLLSDADIYSLQFK
ncbi:hypothetical protein FE783_34330 [Paenibacillus mesophilus]|uniref:hypothetical protein n=1 Tax=Paenibacillus mesophilus TaxID=2582849 RepID=UPI00110E0D36|nr:hypothetical protein [Paenibacillus mesophilus]TMV43844.1 hypothetical protein FE783_34330 [Paenibacillus mesophilus]